MTLIVGDYVRIKNYKFLSGEIGKLEGYDGDIYYKVKLYKTGKIIECTRDEIAKDLIRTRKIRVNKSEQKSVLDF